MKRLILSFFLIMTSVVAMAQDGRMVRGVVLDTNNKPLQNATITAIGAEESFKSGKDGSFIFSVPTYVREVEVSMEGYISAKLEIDGSYLIFKLKVDTEYAKNKEKERIAAEKRAAELAAAKANFEERKSARIEKNSVPFDGVGVQHNINTKFIIVDDFDETKASLEYIIGYRFNRVLFAGIGTGVSFNLQNNSDWYYDRENYVITDTHIEKGKRIDYYFDESYEVNELPNPLISIPLYANIRAYILDGDFSPYVSISTGAILASRASTLYYRRSDNALFFSRDIKYSKTKVFAEASLGVDYKLSSRHSMIVQIGYAAYTQQWYSFSSEDGRTFDVVRHFRIGNLIGGFANLSVGLTF